VDRRFWSRHLQWLSSLSTAILGRLSREVTDAIFGDGELTPGTFNPTESTEIEVVTGEAGDVVLTIRDTLSGAITTIDIGSSTDLITQWLSVADSAIIGVGGLCCGLLK